MLLYCFKRIKSTEEKIQKSCKDKFGRIMLLSKCVVCDCKKSKLIKEQEARELLSILGIITPLSKIPLEDPLFF